MKVFSKPVKVAAIIALGVHSRVTGQPLRHEPADNGEVGGTDAAGSDVVKSDGESYQRRLQKRIYDDKRRTDDALDVHGSVSVNISLRVHWLL